MRLLSVLLLLPVVASCGIQEARNAALELKSSNSLKQAGLGIQNFHDSFAGQPGPGGFGGGEAGGAWQPAVAQAGGVGGDTAAWQKPADQQTAGRQVIYRASISLHVDSFAKTDEKIAVLVKDSGGYISQSGEDRSYGTQRGGRWTVRVPMDKFFTFLDSVGQLGVTDRRDVQSQDVSEEFVDLEARLKNKQALESRLLELVAKRGDEIKDVLALETELSRVREEIERMQGRLRYLNDRVTLTTIEITASERTDYQPPQATLAGRIRNTFWLSLDNLRQFAEELLIALTAIAPWAVVGTVILLPLAAVIRYRWRQWRRTVATPQAA
jgi:hypothetical protein